MSRPAAQDRLGRLLAIVPWVAARDGPAIDQVCHRFSVTEQQLLEDLDLLFMCGVYPFTPDALIEVDIADGRVWIRFAEYFRRPLRLTPPEGLALISAGSALAGVPGADRDGALARALEKLAAVLGVATDDAVAVELGAATPEVLAVVQRAAAAHQRVELDYYSFGRDDRSTRVVPERVLPAGGRRAAVQGRPDQPGRPARGALRAARRPARPEGVPLRAGGRQHRARPGTRGPVDRRAVPERGGDRVARRAPAADPAGQ